MSQLLETRRSLRRKVNANKKLDRFLHLLISGVLLTNIILILYAMFAITIRMTLGGVWIVDTLPVALSSVGTSTIDAPVLLQRTDCCWNFRILSYHISHLWDAFSTS